MWKTNKKRLNCVTYYLAIYKLSNQYLIKEIILLPKQSLAIINLYVSDYE